MHAVLQKNNTLYVKSTGFIKFFRKRPNPYGKYTFCFYPDDTEEFFKINIKNKRRQDVDGEYCIFSNDKPFTLVDANGGPVTDHPGNGSKCVLYLVVSKLKNKKGLVYTVARVHKLQVVTLVQVSDTKSFDSADEVFENWEES